MQVYSEAHLSAPGWLLTASVTDGFGVTAGTDIPIENWTTLLDFLPEPFRLEASVLLAEDALLPAYMLYKDSEVQARGSGRKEALEARGGSRREHPRAASPLQQVQQVQHQLQADQDGGKRGGGEERQVKHRREGGEGDWEEVLEVQEVRQHHKLEVALYCELLGPPLPQREQEEDEKNLLREAQVLLHKLDSPPPPPPLRAFLNQPLDQHPFDGPHPPPPPPVSRPVARGATAVTTAAFVSEPPQAAGVMSGSWVRLQLELNSKTPLFSEPRRFRSSGVERGEEDDGRAAGGRGAAGGQSEGVKEGERDALQQKEQELYVRQVAGRSPEGISEAVQVYQEAAVCLMPSSHTPQTTCAGVGSSYCYICIASAYKYLCSTIDAADVCG